MELEPHVYHSIRQNLPNIQYIFTVYLDMIKPINNYQHYLNLHIIRL